MLDHENISRVPEHRGGKRVRPGVRKRRRRRAPGRDQRLNDTAFEGPIVYTGPLDELFLSRFGRLPYRSLDFVYETHDADHELPCGTVNFTVTEDYTRITEFKHLTGQTSAERPPS